MLHEYLIKTAYSRAERAVFTQADHAARERELASRRHAQYAHLKDLIETSHRSPMHSAASGALKGGVVGALAGLPLSLLSHNPTFSLALGTGGAVGGGMLGHKMPGWSRDQLRSYAQGATPVFMNEDQVQAEALNRGQRRMLKLIARRYPDG